MEFVKKLGKAALVSGLMVMTGVVFAAPININTADAQALASNIRGVGPKKAQAIVVYRTMNGPFKSIHDLVKVKGIGEKLIAKNKNDLLLKEPGANKSH